MCAVLLQFSAGEHVYKLGDVAKRDEPGSRTQDEQIFEGVRRLAGPAPPTFASLSIWN